MAYATIQDMISRFGQVELIRLTTPSDQDLDGIVQAVLDTALESASALADSYMLRRYRTPLDTPPPIVTDMVCDIARYRLSTGDGKTCSEEVRLRNTAAEKWLRDVSVGTVRLDLEEVTPTDESLAQCSVGRMHAFGGGGGW